jgi:hypothetical protein
VLRATTSEDRHALMAALVDDLRVAWAHAFGEGRLAAATPPA